MLRNKRSNFGNAFLRTIKSRIEKRNDVFNIASIKLNLSVNYKMVTFVFLSALSLTSKAQTSSLVSIDVLGNLSYTPDANGNIIPDFSNVGYHQGEEELPNVPMQITLNPSIGDRYADIQNAINSIATLTPDVNGHRGALFLSAGHYKVSETLNISTSGIVIRGEGSDESGTIIELTANTQTDLFVIQGSGNVVRFSSTEKQVTNKYVPIGQRTITVQSGHTFQVDDRVIFLLTTNADWVSLLGMDQLESICGDGHTNWSPEQTHYKRKITKVDGNQITLDAPIVDPVDSVYNTATLAKYTWDNKIEECGIENMRLVSSYTSDTDENHGWSAIKFRNIENAWVKNVNAYYFGLGCVSAFAGTYQLTVEGCGMYDYKSIITGGRRYGFYSDDCELVLFKNCISDKGRHDFVQGSKTPGPNVYTNCTATNSKDDLGPHHRWATGTLWDVVSTNNTFNVQNRLCSGSGHGWAGAQQVLWNCIASKIILHDPPANPTNWAIGCTATITNVGDYDDVVEPLGIVESIDNPIISIPSLYEAQLSDRLSDNLLSTYDEVLEDNPNRLMIYPNPVKDTLFIKNLKMTSVKIYNGTGKLIRDVYYRNQLDVSSLDTGKYFIVFNDNNEVRLLRFIKE